MSGENARSLMRMQTNGRSAATALPPLLRLNIDDEGDLPSLLFSFTALRSPSSSDLQSRFRIQRAFGESPFPAPPSCFFSWKKELYCVGWIPIPQLNNFHGGERRGQQSVFHFFGPLLRSHQFTPERRGDGVGVCRRPSPSRLSDHPPAFLPLPEWAVVVRSDFRDD